MITYQSKLLQIVLLHQTADEGYKAGNVHRKGDKSVISHKESQEVLQKMVNNEQS